MKLILNKIFSIVWSHWLVDGFTGKKCKVVRVKGWRTALIDSPSGGRKTITPLFWPLND